VLKLSGANVLLYWEMMGSDYWLNDGTHPYPAFQVIRMLGEQIPAGSVIVETSNNMEFFYSVAAQAPEHFALVMVNTGSEPLTVSVIGLPADEYTHFQTTETELEISQGTYRVPEDEVTFQLPGASLHVLTTHKP
jgi:hypothetical protein